jgi:hypothetical protein
MFIFILAPKIEIDKIEIRGTKGPRYGPVTPYPLHRKMVIQVLTCYAAEMWWSPNMPTRNCKGISSSTSGKMSRVSHSKNSRDVGPVNRSGKRIGLFSRSPKIPAQTFIENVVWCLASRMACGFACDQICTLWKLKIPSRVNIASSASTETVGAGRALAHCSKHHWQNRTRRGKSSSLRPSTRCRWYVYSRSSRSILQTVLR